MRIDTIGYRNAKLLLFAVFSNTPRRVFNILFYKMNLRGLKNGVF